MTPALGSPLLCRIRIPSGGRGVHADEPGTARNDRLCVLDELLTLLKARRHPVRGEKFLRQVLEGKVTRLEWVAEEDFIQAFVFCQQHRDNSWSFTDCVSFVVIRRLAIKKAFAFDGHFKQFGTVAAVP